MALALSALLLGLGGADAARRVGLSAYQLILRSKVDNGAGGPRAGRDPASLPQRSLAAAARAPNGIGTWTGRPARGVGESKVLRRPGDVLPHRQATGVTSGGCLVDYGHPGSQCVPRRVPGDHTLSCAYLTHQFPRGVPVVGADSLHLDTNRDGRACGPGDSGVAP